MDFNKLEDRWKDRLFPFNLSLRGLSVKTPLGNSNSLSVYGEDRLMGSLFLLSESDLKSMKIGLKFNYLVSKRSLDRFDNLCNEIASDGFQFQVNFKDGTFKNVYNFDKIHLRKFLYDESDVIISNVDFIKRVYIFDNVPILEVIFLISVFDESVDIISKYFEYDSDGNEISNITYPVGTIVSLKEQEKSDYLVQSIKYGEDIKYGLCKLKNTSNSEGLWDKLEVIIMSDVEYHKESEILPNRGYRINQILNN